MPTAILAEECGACRIDGDQPVEKGCGRDGVEAAGKFRQPGEAENGQSVRRLGRNFYLLQRLRGDLSGAVDWRDYLLVMNGNHTRGGGRGRRWVC